MHLYIFDLKYPSCIVSSQVWFVWFNLLFSISFFGLFFYFKGKKKCERSDWVPLLIFPSLVSSVKGPLFILKPTVYTVLCWNKNAVKAKNRASVSEAQAEVALCANAILWQIVFEWTIIMLHEEENQLWLNHIDDVCLWTSQRRCTREKETRPHTHTHTKRHTEAHTNTTDKASNVFWMCLIEVQSNWRSRNHFHFLQSHPPSSRIIKSD